MKNYYQHESKARDADLIEWDPPQIDFEYIAGVVVQRSSIPQSMPSDDTQSQIER